MGMTQREMELREQLDKLIDSTLRFLNGQESEEELAMAHGIFQCECGQWELEDSFEYHKRDLAETEEKICEGCREDE